MRKETINVAVYSAHGNPADVLRVESRPWPRPRPEEVVVELRGAPINPADLNAIEGKYPGKREVPAVPGFEGSGIVSELGKNVSELTIGSVVILPHHLGTWREACAVKAEQLVVVPSEVDPVQAAMLKINPLTAWRLLHGYVELKAGDWVIQNAANSAAGRAVIQIAHGLLIFKDLRFRGIWINKWYDNATPAERMAAFNPIFGMAGRDLLQTKVEKSYPLTEIKAAVEHAARAQRRGKIIFEFRIH